MYMHPQAIIVDASSHEEVFLSRGAQQHLKVTGNTLIELPSNSGKALEWMTKLDSVALHGRLASPSILLLLLIASIQRGMMCKSIY